MGKFDLDDVLKDLRPGAAKAPGMPAPAPQPQEITLDELEQEIESQLLSGGIDEAAVESSARESAPVEPSSALATIEPDPTSDPVETGDLAGVLLARGAITDQQHEDANRVLKQTPGKTISAILIEMGVDEAAVQQGVADIARLPFVRIDAKSPEAFDQKSLHRLTPDFCKNALVLPLRKEGARLVVGTCSPDDVFLLDDVKRKLGVPSIKHVLVTAGDIRGVIEMLTESEIQEYNVDEILSDVDEDDVEVMKEGAAEDDAEDADSSPIVRYVNLIIQTALKEGASDIHIEPDEKSLKVRFRIDGVLFEMMNPPRKMHSALTSRIKIMANLDIAERRLPQDGRIRATVLGRKLDLRVSTVPTPKGEKTVMRILDTRSISVTLDELGFAEETLMIWKNQIASPHGIILVTGPTGSGKTTTLYASIQQMDLRRLNISTVEDPVEYNVPGITQIQTHDKIGMTFSSALRALMRQDPDVILVGEIRDMETATIAIQAAMTGHLVLSTLHTNDAPASITRLINIGIEPFLVGAAVNSVLAQRLIRRICKQCGEERPVTSEIADFLTMHGINADKVRHGKGCEKCRKTGYSGRCGLYELLVLDDHLRDQIARNPNVTEFRRMCVGRGMVTLREDGFKKVATGMTTVEEVLSVTEATI